METTMMERIENRIRELTGEQQNLEAGHNAMVQQNQKLNQEFQQATVKNQTRFAQLTGAITELRQLMNGQKPSAENLTQERTL